VCVCVCVCVCMCVCVIIFVFFFPVHAMRMHNVPDKIEDPWVIGNSKPIQNWLFDRWNVVFNKRNKPAVIDGLYRLREREDTLSWKENVDYRYRVNYHEQYAILWENFLKS